MKASFKATWGLGALALTWALTGCGARAYEGGGDSNSNWLKACDPDAECGSGLECLCGICTMECASDGVCGDDEEASCEMPTGCEEPVAVCTPRKSNGDRDTTTIDFDSDAGRSTLERDDTSDDTVTDVTVPDTTVVDTVSETTIGEVRVDDSDVDTGSDTTTGENTQTTGTGTTTDGDPVTTGTGRGTDTLTGSNTGTSPTTPVTDVPTVPTTGTTGPDTSSATTGTQTNTTATGTETTTTATGMETTTTATGTGTAETDGTAPPVGDPMCSAAGCSDGGACFEPNGRNCVCPIRGELDSCSGLLFQTLAIPETTQSCVSRAVSADGAFVVGSCQIVDGPNQAVLWGPEGATVITGAGVELTQGRGISDDGLTTYWLASDSSTYWQSGSELTQLTGNAGEAFTPDGSVVVGSLDLGLGKYQAFRWTPDLGAELMGALSEEPNDSAVALSADGETAVGYAMRDNVQVPVSWSASGEVQELALLDGLSSGYATDVSADGSVIVGGSGSGHALRWTSGGVELLLEMDDTSNAANLVTRDGSRVFGYSLYGAWMWDETNGVQSLEGLLGMDDAWTITSIADVSADGTTIIGSVQLAQDFSPWRWFAFRGRLPAP